ncbi:MAG: HPr-rel-A system PqqD family peptide chaperone [Magnetococcales bacterium]|nr:HPr-rel-A system PqqD family peptide chaperone [Magnetococcales bacterium]
MRDKPASTTAGISSPTQPLWAAPLYHHFLWGRLDQDHLLMNPLSGKTHLLNELAAEILTELGRGPATVKGLIERLDLAEEEVEAWPQFLRVLDELDRFGLVTPMDPL